LSEASKCPTLRVDIRHHRTRNLRGAMFLQRGSVRGRPAAGPLALLPNGNAHGSVRRPAPSTNGSTILPSCPCLFRLVSSPNGKLELRLFTGNLHTPTMTLKNAALLAFIGTVLMTVLLVWNFVLNLLNLLRGLIAAATVFSSLIYAFGCFGAMVFFFVFHRTQS